MMGGGPGGVFFGKMMRVAGAIMSWGRRGVESKTLSSIIRKANADLSSCGTDANTSSMSTVGGGSGGGSAFGGIAVTSSANETEGAQDEDTLSAAAGDKSPVGADILGMSVEVDSDTTKACGV